MLHKERFILIDDDPINGMICKVLIKKIYEEVEIVNFTEPQEAIQYLEETYRQDNTGTTILLDINMPQISGWDLLEKIHSNSELNLSQVQIYILSSSMDAKDILKGAEHPLVKDYIVKPLSLDKLKGLHN